MQDVTEQIAESRQQVDAIQSPIPERVLKFNLYGPDNVRREYEFIQGELGMFPVQEFVTITSEIIDDFVKGEFGMKIGELFRGDVQMPTDFSPETVDRTVEENIQVIQAFLKAVRIIPGLQKDILCLSLGIWPEQREWFKKAISQAPSAGGLTVDEGFDLLMTFIRQNAKLIRRFFEEKGAELVDVFRLEVLGESPDIEGTTSEDPTPTRTTTESDSPGSTPSSISSPATPVSA